VPRPRWSLEDTILTILFAIVIVLIGWWLAGCAAAASHKTATLRYKSVTNCEWRLSGLETIRAEQLGTELEVGEDCTLKRKADASAEKNSQH